MHQLLSRHIFKRHHHICKCQLLLHEVFCMNHRNKYLQLVFHGCFSNPHFCLTLSNWRLFLSLSKATGLRADSNYFHPTLCHDLFLSSSLVHLPYLYQRKVHHWLNKCHWLQIQSNISILRWESHTTNSDQEWTFSYATMTLFLWKGYIDFLCRYFANFTRHVPRISIPHQEHAIIILLKIITFPFIYIHVNEQFWTMWHNKKSCFI